MPVRSRSRLQKQRERLWRFGVEVEPQQGAGDVVRGTSSAVGRRALGTALTAQNAPSRLHDRDHVASISYACRCANRKAPDRQSDGATRTANCAPALADPLHHRSDAFRRSRSCRRAGQRRPAVSPTCPGVHSVRQIQSHIRSEDAGRMSCLTPLDFSLPNDSETNARHHQSNKDHGDW